MSVEEITEKTRNMDIVDDDEEDKTSEMDAERGTSKNNFSFFS